MDPISNQQTLIFFVKTKRNLFTLKFDHCSTNDFYAFQIELIVIDKFESLDICQPKTIIFAILVFTYLWGVIGNGASVT